MAPIFAQEDIETLTRHFPPLSLAEGKPTLVRSLSGTGLVDFAKVLSRFESLVEQGSSRIEISNINSILGIEKEAEQHILDQCSLQLYYSKDGRSVIPVPIADTIHQDLAGLASSSFVDLGAFAAKQDISLASIDRWIKFDAGTEWQTFNIEEKRILCNQALRSRIDVRIRQVTNEAGSDVCNVSAAFDDEVQTPILQILVEFATKGQGGDVILDGAHVIYVPSEYAAAAEERYRQSQLDQVHLIATELEDNRFAIIQLRPAGNDVPANGNTMDIQGLEQAVRAKFEAWHPEGTQLRTITTSPELTGQQRRPTQDSQTRLLVNAGVLQHELGRLKATAISLIEDDWSHTNVLPDTATTIQRLRSNTAVSPRPGLSKLLLRSNECITELEQATSSRVVELQEEDHAKLVQLLEARLLVPFQLYAAGINTIIDATLRQHLDEFIYDHFRREVIPQTLKSAQEQKLLREKTTLREIEKLRQATTEAKTFTALQTSIAKFTKKLKISSPTSETTKIVQIRTLQQAQKVMKSMTRGSDLLQNLIWILLAQKSGGLFMSSGKDTSRMIKQYEAVGDAEMAGRLSSWRNRLKAGEESKEDLQMMREVARLAVEEVAAAQMS